MSVLGSSTTCQLFSTDANTPSLDRAADGDGRDSDSFSRLDPWHLPSPRAARRYPNPSNNRPIQPLNGRDVHQNSAAEGEMLEISSSATRVFRFAPDFADLGSKRPNSQAQSSCTCASTGVS